MKDDKTLIVSIYALCDPVTCKVRYIGRTSKKVIAHRLIEHISKAKYYHIYYPKGKRPHRINWINSLLDKGYEPVIKLISQVEGWKKSHILERELINKHLLKRHLVNSDDRGEGSKNRTVTDAEKNKISNSLRNYYSTNLNTKAKPIDVYDINGTYLKSYPSATAFAKELKTTPRNVARAAQSEGKRTIKKYQVKYSESNTEISKYVHKTRESYVSIKKRISVSVLDNSTQTVTTYLGLSEACHKLKIPRHFYYNRKKKSDIVTIGNYTFLSPV